MPAAAMPKNAFIIYDNPRATGEKFHNSVCQSGKSSLGRYGTDKVSVGHLRAKAVLTVRLCAKTTGSAPLRNTR